MIDAAFSRKATTTHLQGRPYVSIRLSKCVCYSNTMPGNLADTMALVSPWTGSCTAMASVPVKCDPHQTTSQLQSPKHGKGLPRASEMVFPSREPEMNDKGVPCLPWVSSVRPVQYSLSFIISSFWKELHSVTTWSPSSVKLGGRCLSNIQNVVLNLQRVTRYFRNRDMVS